MRIYFHKPQEPGYFVTGLNKLFAKYGKNHFQIYWREKNGYSGAILWKMKK